MLPKCRAIEWREGARVLRFGVLVLNDVGHVNGVVAIRVVVYVEVCLSRRSDGLAGMGFWVGRVGGSRLSLVCMKGF